MKLKNPWYYYYCFIDWYTYHYRNPYNLNKPFGNCPVQIEGVLDDGKTYYFRSRGAGWSMQLAESETHLLHNKCLFSYCEREYKWPTAGWISKSKAIKYATKALDIYYRNKK